MTPGGFIPLAGPARWRESGSIHKLSMQHAFQSCVVHFVVKAKEERVGPHSARILSDLKLCGENTRPRGYGEQPAHREEKV